MPTPSMRTPDYVGGSRHEAAGDNLKTFVTGGLEFLKMVPNIQNYQ